MAGKAALGYSGATRSMRGSKPAVRAGVTGRAKGAGASTIRSKAAPNNISKVGGSTKSGATPGMSNLC